MLEGRGTAGLQPLGSGAGMLDQWLWQCGQMGWWDMMGCSSRGPMNGTWERTSAPCGRTFPGVLCPVSTKGWWVGGTGAAGAVTGLSQPYLPPALLGLDPALEWPGVQDEEVLLGCGGDLRYSTADTGFLSSLLLTGIRTLPVTVTCLQGTAGSRESWSQAGESWVWRFGLSPHSGSSHPARPGCWRGFSACSSLWLEILPFFREQILCFSCIVVWGPISLDCTPTALCVPTGSRGAP